MPIAYTPELVSELKSLVAGLPRPAGVKAVQKRLKLSERQARFTYAKYFGETVPPHQQPPGIKVDEKDGDLKTEVKTHKVSKIEDVVALCQVDSAKWETRGFSVSQNRTGEFVWRASFKPNADVVGLDLALAQFTQQAASHAPKSFAVKKVKAVKADCCYVLNTQDLHLAKLSWSPETGGGDWDIKIAREAYDAATDDLMAKAPADRIDEVIAIVGSDMLQADNDQSTTTAGTYVDSDSRLAKAFGVATDMLTSRIEKLASRFRVKVIVIPGNHDSTVSLFLGKYVEAWFRNHPNVTVDASPRSRKYHGYGATLIAFDHGDETKLKDLPLIVMRENQSTISSYRYTEVLTGHLHAEKSEDTKGIVVRTAPALCAPDRWHSRRGYIGTVRRSQGLLYQRDNGLEAIYYSKSLDE